MPPWPMQFSCCSFMNVSYIAFHLLDDTGKLIGRFRLDRPVSNLAFGADGRLYITARDIIARVWVKTKPNRIVATK